MTSSLVVLPSSWFAGRAPRRREQQKRAGLLSTSCAVLDKKCHRMVMGMFASAIGMARVTGLGLVLSLGHPSVVAWRFGTGNGSSHPAGSNSIA